MYSANEHITGSGLASLLLGPDYGSVVRVVYSDESGVGSERDEPLTVIAGLMLNMDSQWHPVLESIEDVLANCVGEEKIATYEIRGRNLYHKIKIGDDEA